MANHRTCTCLFSLSPDFLRGALRALPCRYVKLRRLISSRPHMNKAPEPARYRRAITAPYVPLEDADSTVLCIVQTSPRSTIPTYPRLSISNLSRSSGFRGTKIAPLGSKFCSWLTFSLFHYNFFFRGQMRMRLCKRTQCGTMTRSNVRPVFWLLFYASIRSAGGS